MERSEAIDILAEGRGDAISVATMQSASPWYEAGQSDGDHVDASACMGSASSLGLGLAIARPDRKVMVLDGDGSLLMQLGSLVSIAESSPANFYHFVFANGLNQILTIKIDEELTSMQDRGVLEDLIVGAINDVHRKVKELSQAEMSKLTGGIKIPGLFS